MKAYIIRVNQEPHYIGVHWILSQGLAYHWNQRQVINSILGECTDDEHLILLNMLSMQGDLCAAIIACVCL